MIHVRVLVQQEVWSLLSVSQYKNNSVWAKSCIKMLISVSVLLAFWKIRKINCSSIVEEKGWEEKKSLWLFLVDSHSLYKELKEWECMKSWRKKTKEQILFISPFKLTDWMGIVCCSEQDWLSEEGVCENRVRDRDRVVQTALEVITSDVWLGGW